MDYFSTMKMPFRVSRLVAALFVSIHMLGPIERCGTLGANCTEANEKLCHLNFTSPDATAETIMVPSQLQHFDVDAMFQNLLAEDYDSMDPNVLHRSIRVLKKRGAHLSWHKHSTFLQHLLGVHNILRLWGQGAIIGRVGLFHSVYSNSYVNLSLFDPTSEEDRVLLQHLVGSRAENLVHLFCIVDRQTIVVNTLLKQGYIPQEGMIVPNIRNASEEIYLSPEILRMLIVFTMADTADQYFGWQDQLFGGGGSRGSMIIPGHDVESKHCSTAAWPGVSKPGVWMSYLSLLGQVVRTFTQEGARSCDINSNATDCWNEEPLWAVPPIFENCTKTLSVEDETDAMELYWSVITKGPALTEDETSDDNIMTLKTCVEKNPWIFEPHVLLAQKYLHRNDFVNAEQSLQTALFLQKQWGTAWDKRLGLGAWVSWTRVLYQLAQDQVPWSHNSWQVNNLGMVPQNLWM